MMHAPEMHRRLAQIKQWQDELAQDGIPRLRVLIGCERSNMMAKHFAMSGCQCATADLLDCEDPRDDIPHFKGDVRLICDLGWDLCIFHPDCRVLSNAGIRWIYVEPQRVDEMRESARFFRHLTDTYPQHCPFVCCENPKPSGLAKSMIALAPTQYINAYEHGVPEQKLTALWL